MREELEKAISSYFSPSNTNSEQWLPVVVAPYGSGKTTLLEHLARYAEAKGIRALHVELQRLVDFIVEKYGVVHESKLPHVLEEFFERETGAKRGLLLLDEVEEAYDSLRGIVEYETSPFRGLAEAIRTRKSRVFTIMAFGPSSILKEAIFGPVAWRSRIYQIPILSKTTIAGQLAQLIADETTRELLANTLWWASKGRMGWAKLLVGEVKPLVEALAKGLESLEEVLLSSEVFSREVVDGVPVMDKTGYQQVKNLLGHASHIAPLLAILVGPVPYSLVSRYAGEEVLGSSPAHIAVRSVVRVEDVLSEAEKLASRLSRLYSISEDSLEHGLYILGLVLKAWSLRGLLAYEPSSLQELVELAADMARELFPGDAGAYRLLSLLGVDVLGLEPKRYKEPLIALRPSMIPRIYPLLSSNPLVGCARRAGASNVVKAVESLGINELEEYFKSIDQLLQFSSMLGEGYRLVVVTASHASRREIVDKLVCSMAGMREKPLLLILSPRDEAGPPAWATSLSRLGALSVAVVRGKPALLVYSLIYNTMLCGLDKLAEAEKRIVKTYGEAVRSSLKDAVASPGLGGLEPLARLAELEEEHGRIVQALEALAACSVGERLVGYVSRLLKNIGASPELAEEVLGEAAKLREELEEAIAGLPGSECTPRLLARVSPVLARILAGKTTSPPEEWKDKLVRYMASLKDALKLPGVGDEASKLLEQARSLLEDVEGLLEEAGDCPPAKILAGLVAEEFMAKMKARARLIEDVARAVSRLEEQATVLQGEARNIALRAVEEAARSAITSSSMTPLMLVSEYMARLIEFYQEARRLEEATRRMAAIVEEALSKLLEEGPRLPTRLALPTETSAQAT